MKRVDVFTLVPGAFDWFLGQHPISTAVDAAAVEISVHNLRDYSPLPHRGVDDSPYGGGPGMVTRVDIVGQALGHRNYSTTQRYAPIQEQTIRASMERGAEAMRRAAGLRPGGGDSEADRASVLAIPAKAGDAQ